MKKGFSLKQIIIAISAVAALVVGATFLLMYSSQFIDNQNANIEPSKSNSIVLSPKSFGSYGELMFAYIGEHNYIYNLDDESKPLIQQPASILLYASDDTVIYTATAETDATHLGRESVIQELQIGENENTLFTIATVSIDPCWSSNDEVVYFVKDENRKQLCTFEPLTSTTEVAAEFESSIVGLRISSDGLLVSIDTGEEKLYVPLSKQLTEAYYNCQGSRIIVCEQYDLILTPDGILYYRWLGSNEAVKIADHVVTTQGYQDNQIFFIQQNNDGMTLNDYFVSEEQIVELTKLPDNILPQLTVSADYAFVIDDSFLIYKYDIDSHEFFPFEIVKETVLNPLISVFDYRLMVYDISKEIDCSYVYSVDATKMLTDDEIALYSEYQEQSVQNINPDYVEYTTLEMGSIGGDVVTLQTSLLNLGYTTAEPTGIFDVDTTVAIQYLQNDLGVTVSGIATKELQYKIASDVTAKHEGYSAISTTSEGIRVNDLQARLRTLNYMSDGISGVIDKPTEEAITRFAKQNGYEYSGGVIAPEILNGLFNADATVYHGYIDVANGHYSNSVLLLNQRLNQLGYLKGSVNPFFDHKTESAINLFSTVNGQTVVDSCSAELAELIFSESAKTCPTELAPSDVNDSLSVNENQVISDRQLKIIRKWLTKQFAVNHTDKQAVKRLQMQLVKLGYMSLNNVSMVYDQTTMDAVSSFQNANELLADGIATKTTLTEIFSTTINGSTEEQE